MRQRYNAESTDQYDIYLSAELQGLYKVAGQRNLTLEQIEDGMQAYEERMKICQGA